MIGEIHRNGGTYGNLPKKPDSEVLTKQTEHDIIKLGIWIYLCIVCIFILPVFPVLLTITKGRR